jgi:hypothetical protein
MARRNYRSFADRLAALEQLEAEQEATVSTRYPPVATLCDEEIIAHVVRALRRGLMYCWSREHVPEFILCELFGLKDPDLERWYGDMKPRAQLLIDARAEAIAALIPPHCGDGRVISNAVYTVLRGWLEQRLAELTEMEQV